MMIDVNLPLELDDGTPVELISFGHGNIHVRVPKSPTRPGKPVRFNWDRAAVWCYEDDGVFGGGNPVDQYTLRNVVDPFEMEFDI